MYCYDATNDAFVMTVLANNRLANWNFFFASYDTELLRKKRNKRRKLSDFCHQPKTTKCRML